MLGWVHLTSHGRGFEVGLRIFATEPFGLDSRLDDPHDLEEEPQVGVSGILMPHDHIVGSAIFIFQRHLMEASRAVLFDDLLSVN